MNDVKIDLYRNDNKTVIDAFDRLVVNAFLKKMKDSCKTFLICGCDARVGTTSISVEMAISMAVSGWRTILVDADLRKESRYKRLNQKTEAGLSDYTSGDELDGKYIYKTNWPDLDYMSCGKNDSETPVKVFCSTHMEELIGKLRDRYDIIVFDAASMHAAVDAKILGSKVDCTYVVAASEQTTFETLSMAHQQLEEAGATIGGVILNKLPMDDYSRYLKNYDYFQKKEYIDVYNKHLPENGQGGTPGRDNNKKDNKNGDKKGRFVSFLRNIMGCAALVLALAGAFTCTSFDAPAAGRSEDTSSTAGTGSSLYVLGEGKVPLAQEPELLSQDTLESSQGDEGTASQDGSGAHSQGASGRGNDADRSSAPVISGVSGDAEASGDAVVTEAEMAQLPILMVTDYQISAGTAEKGGTFTLDAVIKNVRKNIPAYQVVMTVYLNTEGLHLKDGETNQRYFEFLDGEDTVRFEMEIETDEEYTENSANIEMRFDYVNQYGFTGSNTTSISPEISDRGELEVLSVTTAENAMMGSHALFNIRYSNTGETDIKKITMRLIGNIEGSGEETDLQALDKGQQVYLDKSVVFTKAGNQTITVYISYEDENGVEFSIDPLRVTTFVTEKRASNAVEIKKTTEASGVAAFISGHALMCVVAAAVVIWAVVVTAVLKYRKRHG